MKILAITSCPNGIAHTYMAQEKLEQAAKEMGVEIKVETQGGVGTENALTAKEIREADGIIIAADRQVDLSRFDGKRLINENVREGIHKPKELIQRIIDQDARIYHDKTHQISITKRTKKVKVNSNGISTPNEWCFIHGTVCSWRIAYCYCINVGRKTNRAGIGYTRSFFWKSIENIGKLSFGLWSQY